MIKTRRFALVPINIITDPNIPLSAFRIYVYLRLFNPCTLGYTQISSQAGLSRTTISKAIKWLVENNLIEYSRGDHLLSSNEYFFIDQ